MLPNIVKSKTAFNAKATFNTALPLKLSMANVERRINKCVELNGAIEKFEFPRSATSHAMPINLPPSDKGVARRRTTIWSSSAAITPAAAPPTVQACAGPDVPPSSARPRMVTTVPSMPCAGATSRTAASGRRVHTSGRERREMPLRSISVMGHEPTCERDVIWTSTEFEVTLSTGRISFAMMTDGIDRTSKGSKPTMDTTVPARPREGRADRDRTTTIGAVSLANVLSVTVVLATVVLVANDDDSVGAGLVAGRVDGSASVDDDDVGTCLVLRVTLLVLRVIVDDVVLSAVVELVFAACGGSLAADLLPLACPPSLGVPGRESRKSWLLTFF